MKKALFIDRDGTVIHEPPGDFQIDSLEKLEFVPGVIRNLRRIREKLDYELVMVTNQDGLGSDAYPEASFRLVQGKMLRLLEGEGILFDDILVDRSWPHEQKPTRKPGTGMLGRYLAGSYDLGASFVIGDRLTDLELAANLGCAAILYRGDHPGEPRFSGEVPGSCVLATDDWDAVYSRVAAPLRIVRVERTTRETSVMLTLNLDGTGETHISTGLGFFDHMLEQVGRHAGIDLSVKASGDLHVDEHHTVEDTALVLGEAVARALGDKKGIERYGFVLPMDDCLAAAVIDFGGRAWLEWQVSFRREKTGDLPTDLYRHFFRSFADAARCNLHIRALGYNDHHKAEAVFKAFARALRNAIRRDVFSGVLPSTKGIL